MRNYGKATTKILSVCQYFHQSYGEDTNVQEIVTPSDVKYKF